jgi:lipoate-protein ligase A
METLTSTTWQIITTPPLSGTANMAYDVETLAAVSIGAPPVLRFFQFNEPTVTYGCLQRPDAIASLIPAGWPAVQRPTGGGIVFHCSDLCLSLCWPKSGTPLPDKPKSAYAWIHAVIRTALDNSVRMASCADECSHATSFAMRDCFTQPVGYDLMLGAQKIVGGAMRFTRSAVLYQGSIQNIPTRDLADQLAACFELAFHPAHA